MNKSGIAIAEKLIIVCSLLLSLAHPSGSQTLHEGHFPVINFSTADGLPSNAIRSIYRQEDGLLWLGTDAGLASYDGNEFKVFSTEDGLAGNKIWAVTGDNEGKLWLGCYGDGLCYSDGMGFESLNLSAGKISKWIRVLHYSNRFELLLIGTEEGLGIMKDELFIQLPKSPVDPANIRVVTGIEEGDDRIIITSYKTGIYYYFPEKGVIVHKSGKDELYPSSSSAAFIPSNGDTLFSYYRKGLIRRNSLGNVSLIDTSFGQVFSMDEDRNEDVWIAAWSFDMIERGGIYKLKDGGIENISERLGISSEQCWQVLCENESGFIWIATLDQGLYQVFPYGGVFYGAEDVGVEQLKVNDILSASDGRLWLTSSTDLITIGEGLQIDRLDQAELKNQIIAKRKRNGLHAGESWDQGIEDYHLSGISDFFIIREDGQKKIWVSFGDGGICYHTPDRFSFLTGLDDKYFDFTKEGNILAGSWNSFESFQIQEDPVKCVKQALPPGDQPNLNISNILSIGDDTWITTTSQGIFRYRNGIVTRLKDQKAIHHEITTICTGPKGFVFAGDPQGKIILLNVTLDSAWVKFTLNDVAGFSSGPVNWIEYDPRGYLWAGTRDGIHCFLLEDLQENKVKLIRSFKNLGGLIAEATTCAEIDRDGFLWVGHPQGISKINTRKTYNDLSIRPALIPVKGILNSDPVIDSSIVNPDVLEAYERLTLPYRNSGIRISFSLLNYLNPSGNELRYQLQGLDDHWSEWDKNLEVKYNNLPAGEYTLMIQGRNSCKPLIISDFSIEIIVPLPWYLNWISWATAGLVLIILFFIILKTTKRRIERKAKQEIDLEKRLNELEVKALQAQMNPHFVFNSINAIQGHILSDNQHEAIELLGHFSKVVRASLENIDRKKITLEEALEFLRSYLLLERMRFPDKFDWEIDVPPHLDPRKVFIPPMVIQPYVENAIRHGIRNKKGKGHIQITIEYDQADEILKIIILDDGIGLSRAKEIQSRQGPKAENDRLHSSEVTAKRVRMMNKPGEKRYDVRMEEILDRGEVQGTRVVITLPVLSSP